MALECTKGNRALKAFKRHKSNCMLWQLVQIFDKVLEETNHSASKSYYSKKGLVLCFNFFPIYLLLVKFYMKNVTF